MSDEMTTVPEWMTTLAAGFRSCGLDKPFAKDGWCGITNGWWLVAMRFAGPDDCKVEIKHLLVLTANSDNFSLAHLRDWLQPKECSVCHGEPSQPCRGCDGAGFIDCECTRCYESHERECESCNGAGKTICAVCAGDQIVDILGKSFDLILLRAALRPELSGLTFKMQLHHDDKLLLEGDSWKVIVMATKSNPNKGSYSPEVALPLIA